MITKENKRQKSANPTHYYTTRKDKVVLSQIEEEEADKIINKCLGALQEDIHEEIANNIIFRRMLNLNLEEEIKLVKERMLKKLKVEVSKIFMI